MFGNQVPRSVMHCASRCASGKVVVGAAIVVVVVVVVVGAVVVVVVGWGTDGCSVKQFGSDDNAVVMLTNRIGKTAIADNRCLDERTHHVAALPAASSNKPATIRVALRPVAGNKHTSVANIRFPPP